MQGRDRSGNGTESRGLLTGRLAAVAAVTLAATSCRSAGSLAGSIPGASALGLAPVRLELDQASLEATRASGTARMVRTPDQVSVSLDEAVEALASADVVFLGELHDNTEGHAVQLALTRGLADARGSMILSMEMLERDAQRRLDLYLDGVLSEEEYLAGTRQWGNYARHYRGAVELAKERGFRVVAGNVYRPIASRVARKGLAAGLGDPWAARSVDVSDGEYKRRFLEIMSGGHGGAEGAAPDPERLDRVFAAQCIKDATMAESIANALEDAGEPAPVVVHWNGRFHSDYGLGTVERLRRRVPGLNIAVVSMIATDDIDRELVGEEVDQGHFVILVPPEPSDD